MNVTPSRRFDAKRLIRNLMRNLRRKLGSILAISLVSLSPLPVMAQMPPPTADGPGTENIPPEGVPGNLPSPEGQPPAQRTPSSQSPQYRSEEEDFSETPFTRYGEFNESEDEEADDKFFQFGRFFGVSFGIGSQFIDGNRGALWQGGFPSFDFKLHYWFDFNFALSMGFTTSQQYFDTTAPTTAPLGHVDVNMVRVGLDLKYYLPIKDLSAAISFAGPYLILGAGAYTKTENSNAQQVQDQDASMGMSGGFGLEFTLSPRKSYLALEFKANVVTFKDTYTTNFESAGLTNLTGNFYTAVMNILFTW